MKNEYNDRWNKQIVNPGFTMAEYEASKPKIFQFRHLMLALIIYFGS